jgi:hypothetical protein
LRSLVDRFVRHLRSGHPAVVILNTALRIGIVLFTIDALVNAGDERFAGKALGPRNVGILLGFSMLFPILQWGFRRWKRYPWWSDCLYLSVPFLDMLGNTLNLYNSIEWWDHVPHLHGTGALAVVFMAAFDFAPIAAAGLATMLHTALEIDEYYGDVLFHTHNVKGIADSINDLAFGLAGVIAYVLLYRRLRPLRRREPRRGSERPRVSLPGRRTAHN